MSTWSSLRANKANPRHAKRSDRTDPGIRLGRNAAEGNSGIGVVGTTERRPGVDPAVCISKHYGEWSAMLGL
jgi:hypothetical protein